jgi:two-component system response regulator HydG
MPPRDEKPRVLVVDDELPMAEMLADGLADRGFAAEAVASSEVALTRIAEDAFDAVVTDLRMPKVDGLELCARIHAIAPHVPVLVMTAYGAIDTAIESIRQGAYHYLTKPFKLDELVLFLGRALDEGRLRREATALRTTLRERFSPEGVLGKSAAMREVLEVIARVATTDVPVLIVGETGTGKSLLARTLHAQSARSSGPLVTLNCAALPEALLESELFGHVRGSFTGATADRPGLFAEADGGTLFLDEIAEMSPPLQAKLLDVLERHRVRAVGASKEREVDVRVVAATHRDLAERARAGAFREDLRYRLEVVTIELPPLRHRREDIPELVGAFLAESRAKHPGSPVARFSAEALGRLLDYPWPGNVRELSHAIERAVLLGRSQEASIADLPPALRVSSPLERPLDAQAIMPIREVQRRYAAWALEKLGGHRTRTAEKLGVDLKTLAKWLSEIDAGREPPQS